jgi:hypothetical protein
MVHGVRPLLTTWGGEGIYMASGGSSLREALLQGIGTSRSRTGHVHPIRRPDASFLIRSRPSSSGD